MEGTRTTQLSDPGNFRESQNWIGGTTPTNAIFVPPPPTDMKRALDDFEKFLHAKDDLLPLIKAGLIHAQFETIHPFLDGNGRTGRLLITFFFGLEDYLTSLCCFYLLILRSIRKCTMIDFMDIIMAKWRNGLNSCSTE
jgi:Fic family protein